MKPHRLLSTCLALLLICHARGRRVRAACASREPRRFDRARRDGRDDGRRAARHRRRRGRRRARSHRRRRQERRDRAQVHVRAGHRGAGPRRHPRPRQRPHARPDDSVPRPRRRPRPQRLADEVHLPGGGQERHRGVRPHGHAARPRRDDPRRDDHLLRHVLLRGRHRRRDRARRGARRARRDGDRLSGRGQQDVARRHALQRALRQHAGRATRSSPPPSRRTRPTRSPRST